jgi:peroxiredoxin Q/BCP
MKQLREGAKAPKFALEDKDGRVYGVGKEKADYTVLYFYPKDDTPGCTIEAQEFSSNLKDFKSRKASVIGISGGDQKTKAKFCGKYKLQVPLVSDTNFSVSRAYGAYGDKKFMGRSFKGIHRKTFIVDSAGTIAKVFDSVKPEGHAEEVLEAIDALRAGVSSRTSKAKATVAKKSAAKKTIARKVTVQKSTVAKTAARKTTARKATTRTIAKKVQGSKVLSKPLAKAVGQRKSSAGKTSRKKTATRAARW